VSEIKPPGSSPTADRVYSLGNLRIIPIGSGRDPAFRRCRLGAPAQYLADAESLLSDVIWPTPSGSRDIGPADIAGTEKRA
jgi:hypothetical protein